eukprot:SAG22_NODE_18356_length_288_cov_1.619048_1_plen_38_part_10
MVPPDLVLTLSPPLGTRTLSPPHPKTRVSKAPSPLDYS